MLDRVKVCPIQFDEREKWQSIMSRQHYPGHAHPFGNTICYVAERESRWLALIGFFACALKCKPRDEWIGWSQAIQFQRLHLIANNTRFLIVDEDPFKNLASKVLSLCLKRISKDWESRFGYPIVLVETFVDPKRLRGPRYKASNWQLSGKTKGYRKHHGGYLQNNHSKLIFVIGLHKKAKEILSSLSISSHYLMKKPMITLNTSQTISLYRHLLKIKDPRGKYDKSHKKTTILIIRRFLQKLDPESADLHLSSWIAEHVGKPKAIGFHQSVEKAHGRFEERKIYCSSEINDYVEFPYVRQVFRIERFTELIKKNTSRGEIAYGITNMPKECFSPEDVLHYNRNHRTFSER